MSYAVIAWYNDIPFPVLSDANREKMLKLDWKSFAKHGHW
jgi:hypothetical protein